MAQQTLNKSEAKAPANSPEGKGPVAHILARSQRDIGVAEFFARNRHLLGFDNKKKALMTTIKEAVDNSLDACEEAKVLPEISVEIIDMGNDRRYISKYGIAPNVIGMGMGVEDVGKLALSQFFQFIQ